MVIAISNHKGGTGKTTTAVNLGVALANLNFKVLLIDLDAQGNLTYSFGIQDTCLSISDVFIGEKKIEEVIIRKEGLDIIPANMQLSDIELSLQSVDDRVYVLKYMLDSIVSNYDFVIIDCPPSRSLLTINALIIADKVISTILLDVLSIQGLNHIRNTVNEIKEVFNEKLSFMGVLAVNTDMRKKISLEVLEFIRQNIDIPILMTNIRANVKITEAPSYGLSVIAYDPTSNGAIDYESLALEISTLK
jgi:chromosome partitioning protein